MSCWAFRERRSSLLSAIRFKRKSISAFLARRACGGEGREGGGRGPFLGLGGRGRGEKRGEGTHSAFAAHHTTSPPPNTHPRAPRDSCPHPPTRLPAPYLLPFSSHPNAPPSPRHTHLYLPCYLCNLSLVLLCALCAVSNHLAEPLWGVREGEGGGVRGSEGRGGGECPGAVQKRTMLR
jgi:hypothetical protein